MARLRIALKSVLKLFGDPGRTPAEVLTALETQNSQKRAKGKPANARVTPAAAHTPRAFVEAGEPSIGEELNR